MITPAHVQQVFASHNLALHRYSQSPELCDRQHCEGLDVAGRKVVYLAAGAHTDFVVVVLPTVRDATQIASLRPGTSERRENTLLLYLASAKARLSIVRRVFATV